MLKLLSIALVFICISAGCITESQGTKVAGEVQLQYQKTIQPVYHLIPGEGTVLFSGDALCSRYTLPENPAGKNNYTAGYITVSAGKKTPVHSFEGRSEYIFITKGMAEIECGGDVFSAGEYDSIIIPAGAEKSVFASGGEDLVYIHVIEPACTQDCVHCRENISAVGFCAERAPEFIPDPKEGIEWDIGSDMIIYSLANPYLMPEMDIPFKYSTAYAELLPGGAADENYLKGSTELIIVIEGEIEVYAPGGDAVRAAAGDAIFIPASQAKGYRNSGENTSKILSITDPAWRPEITFET